MGSNPEMFKSYLDNQTSVLSDLLRRFAEPTLVKDTTHLRDVGANVSDKTEQGRVRVRSAQRSLAA